MSALEVKLHSISLKLISLNDKLEGIYNTIHGGEINEAKDMVSKINKEIHSLLNQLKV